MTNQYATMQPYVDQSKIKICHARDSVSREHSRN